MNISIKHWLIASFLLNANWIVPINGQGDALVELTFIDSADGVLDTTMTIDYGTYTQPGLTLTNTRLFNGALPGPVLRVSPGDTMNILFQNNLEAQDGAVTTGENIFKLPDTSNLHFHGAHVSGELPSDDVRFDIGPGEEYQYSTTFPDNHMGGTHWIHPHVHGSSTLQVAGGAAAGLIVRDDNEEDDLPSEVTDATELVLLIQEMYPDVLDEARDESGDTTLEIDDSSGVERWFIVNGQYQPEYAMTANTWYRFRIIHGGFEEDPTGLSVSGCEMQLLAKDGVYIQDFPRAVDELPIPAGGRADVMFRCENTGDFTMTDYDGDTVMTFDVTGSGSASDLPSWTVNYPDYLTDLTSTSASSGCSCETDIGRCNGEDGFCINDELWDEDRYIHTVAFGSVVEREIRGSDRHPYHQHVYPFQLVDDINGISGNDADYWQVGDWHDVLQIESSNGGITVRYTADVHLGVIMLHCHILEHEDEGTMNQEYVTDDGSCECDAFTRLGGGGGGGGICFSSVATAIVENQGKTQMKDIQVGDKVLTGSGEYKTVYTIDHKSATKKTRFLQIHSTETNDPLEVTESHMVFVNNSNNAIPASQVKVGDKMQTLNGTSTVTKILHITRDGFYNPMTTDGTIVVDDVISSNYALAFGDENIRVFGFTLMSHHDFLHLLMTPYRAMCVGVSLSLCETNHEFNIYSWLGTNLLFTLKQNIIVRDVITLFLLLVFGLLYLGMNPLTICFIVGAAFLYLTKGKKKFVRK